MILHPNCKINLGLRVVRKRADGYHDLETVFVPVYGLHDELEIVHDCTIQEDYTFQQEGIAVDCQPEDNLIIRCYEQFKKKYPQIGKTSIRFKKNIPFGAGLGGGSSDAAHMAVGLNALYGLGLSKAQLAEEVRTLGADCPFFVYNTPCYAEGIGDILTPIELKLQGMRIVLVKPEEGVSTKEAYSGIKPRPEVAGEIQKAVAMMRQKCTEIDDTIFVNDFEATVFPGHPVIAAIKKRLLDAGAYYASMSGSGSTVFGLFENDTEGRTDAQLRVLKDEFASMVLLDDTFGEWKS
ncbi:MAG: 4-(cytidine 5'-diphospho)-2-C-methyl-D-erythritol kinase [Paludibacteraceae bacterium]|nr:4-(cytidine 5'-diphospho)-2-C-methyl-D-erythritol kinase [Paludibacteraceae bacterium]